MEAYPLPRQGANHGEALHSAHGAVRQRQRPPPALGRGRSGRRRALRSRGGLPPLSGGLRRRAVHRFFRRRAVRAGPSPVCLPGRRRPLRAGARRLRGAGAPLWKPPSVPAPPTTNFWTPSPPSATPGRGCAASPWTPRWATPPTVFPALPPYLHLLGGQEGRTSFLKGLLPPCLPLAGPSAGDQASASARMAEAQLAAADFGTLCRVSPEAMGGLLRQKNIFLT